MKSIKRILISLSTAMALLFPVAAPVTVAAQSIQDGLCKGTQLNVEAESCDPTTDTEAEGKVQGIINLVINIFSLVVGVISVIMIIIGGLKYITSGGESGNVTTAKNTILYAIIGLVVVALAQFIVRFVLNKATTV
jgi:cytochrome bd-type quinol oxidase subunit 2